ncbi:MAG: hypothetical protein QOG59_2565, partial [Solirubrobacteraceae bacterium]|nr:hypothetical protein [Solirubrobacteraceae bacterium]
NSQTMSTDAILRFIEDRFAGHQRIGSGSLDNLAGSLDSVFSAPSPHTTPLTLNPNSGQPTHN